MSKSRPSYTCAKKPEIVEYAEPNGNRSASLIYKVDEKSVRNWLRQKQILETIKSLKHLRLRNPFWPELELDLKKWTIEERNKGRKV